MSGTGRVYVVARVFPEDVTVDLETLKKRISEVLPKEYQLVKIEEEPIAFGLKALKVHIIMAEQVEGGTEQLEQILSGIEKVSQVEIVYVSRLPV